MIPTTSQVQLFGPPPTATQQAAPPKELLIFPFVRDAACEMELLGSIDVLLLISHNLSTTTRYFSFIMFDFYYLLQALLLHICMALWVSTFGRDLLYNDTTR